MIPGQKSSILTFKYMLAGGFAGAVSRTCTAPLDRLKILLQVNSSQSSMSRWQESIQLCRRILNEGGITAFWRGNGVNIVKIIPESAIRFYVFEWCKRLLQQNRAQQYHRRRSNDPSVKVHNLEITWQDRLIAGGVAGFASQLTIYPLETVKTRMMAELKHTQVGSNRIRAIDVARQMWRTDGVRAFFRGLGPSLFG
jgi:solute carrier family 25 phosphate transporter 23/24/25/41